MFQKRDVHGEKTQLFRLHIEINNVDLFSPRWGRVLQIIASEISIMKKLIYVTAVCLAIASVGGCSRSWPSCFCNRQPSYQSVECCETCETCDPCTQNYYMPATSDVEWVPQGTPTYIDSLPTPGPATTGT